MSVHAVTADRVVRCGVVPAFARRSLVVLAAVVVLAMIAFVVWMVVFNPASYQCISRVDGQLVEHRCSEAPPG